MEKPTPKEITKAREMVQRLFLDSDWFELMKCWEGVGWHRSDVMCGMLVGLQIAENRNARNNDNRKPSGRRSKAARD